MGHFLATDSLLKTYTDKVYRHTTLVSHKGTVIAFAMDQHRQIYYAVLALEQADGAKGSLDVNYWPEDPRLLSFPGEIEQVGFSIAGATRIPLVKKGSRLEARHGELLPEEIDGFLSSTARLTADAPIQVFSDNKHIFVFRQSIGAQHEDAVHKLSQGGASGDGNRPDDDFVQHDGARVPLVDRTLLCDRFILAGSELRSKMEVRYRRSRHKSQPAGSTDSLGARDMEGNPFFEPTRELAFVQHLTSGQFSVLQLPTQVSGVKRWQIFAYNSATSRMDSFNLEVSGDGLFNPAGTQLYTSPEPEFQSAVLEREPGTCPFTSRPLIPVAQKSGHAETALRFNGVDQRIDCGKDASLDAGSLTVEAWLYIDDLSPDVWRNIAARHNDVGDVTQQKGFYLGLYGDQLRFGVYNGHAGLHHWAGSYQTSVPAREWVHVAVTWSAANGTMRLYVNGQQANYFVTGVAVPIVYDSANSLFLNAYVESRGYCQGIFDEVRVWNRALSREEIHTGKNMRLIGDEPGLVGYWRFDEGSGDIAYDQTSHGNHGTLLNGPTWVASDAPIGDHPGMRRSSFSLAGLEIGQTGSVTGGVAAHLYYQQEDARVGYANLHKPMKKQARAMLAFTTSDENIAALDFAVSREGRLAQVPDNIALPEIAKPQGSADSQVISGIEDAIRLLNGEVNELTREVGEIKRAIAAIPTLEAEKTGLQSSVAELEKEANDITKHWIRISFTIWLSKQYAFGDGNEVLMSSTHSTRWKFEETKDGYYLVRSESNNQVMWDNGDYRAIGLTDNVALHEAHWRVTITTDGYEQIGGVLYKVLNLRLQNKATGRSADSHDTFRSREGSGTLFEIEFTESLEGDTRSSVLAPLQAQLVALADKTAELDERYAAQNQLAEKEMQLQNKDHALSNKQAELSLLTGGLASDISLPMAAISTDSSGLTVSGGVLAFTATSDAPALFESATGMLTLYYRDRSGQLTAAYYDTRVGRTHFKPAGHGLTFVARSAGDMANAASIHISDGQDADTCTLTMEHPQRGWQETWRNLPRDAEEFAAIVSGRSALPDGAQASVSPEIVSLAHGSPQFTVRAGSPARAVANGAAVKTREGLNSQWIGDAPGRAYYFDGYGQVLTLAGEQPDFDIDKNFTLEAWLNAAGVPGHTRVVHHHGEQSAYLLALVQAADQTYHVLAGVSGGHARDHEGQQMVRSQVTIAPNQWNHVAYTFTQSYALAFASQGYLDAGSNPALDLADDLTIEVSLQLDQVNRAQGLLSKGYVGDPDHRVPYQLAVDSDGKLRFAFEDAEGRVSTYRSTGALSAGQFHRVAVTRKRGVTQTEKKGTQTLSYQDAEGNAHTQEVEMVESVEANEWMEITFYVDGQAAGTSRHTQALPAHGQGHLEIGRHVTASGEAAYAQGTFGEVRLWNTARSAEQIGAALQGTEQGLIAWWRFEDNRGNLAADSKGDSHAKIKGATWAKNPDPRASVIAVYVNGIKVPTEALPATDPFVQAGWGDLQFSLGGRQNGAQSSDNRPENLLNGVLEEVRIWRTVRTPEQLLDNLFTRLKGERQDLIAYYTFDDDSTAPEADTLHDHGLRGNDIPLPTGDARPTSVISTAPISSDAAMVRSALSGVATAFHERADGPPAVGEYADMQRDSRGNITGVMKRCYSYLQDGKWALFTGYKVGNLISEWIGQANFEPQVIGYLEGVPPVPSENLTDGAISVDIHNYAFIGTLSNIELTESERVSYTLSSSKEGSVDGAFDAAVSIGAGNKTMLITAPMGFGIGTEATDLEFEAGLKGHFEGSAGWANEESFGSSLNQSHTLTMELGGAWEDPDPQKQLNPNLGRRLLTVNTGFAVVQSETADIFALRLAHNNALVSFRMQPNPDIPKEKNIIPFPINPRYVKQGTLDGTIGYDADGRVVRDPDYAVNTGYGEYSYFKPREAYALKRRIIRQQQALQNYYENAGTDYSSLGGQIVGSAAKAAAGLLSGASPVAAQGIQDVSDKTRSFTGNKGLPAKFAKRDIADTFIWTADGGFYAETTETSDIRTDSTSGNFSFSGSIGGTFSADVEIFSIGVGLEFEAALGGGYATSRTRDKESEKTFSMNVGHDVPGDLQIYYRDEDGHLKRRYDQSGKPLDAVGKVDAYRWMSFYLDSDKDNFEDLFHKVVDPVWLEESDHPNAIALRQAYQADKKPACWRVLHRVTFVSRLLPEFSDPSSAPVEAAMKAQNINSNWQLIQKLAPFVKNKTGDAIAFTAAVRKALAQYLPELQPHATEIISYLKLYYGMPE